MNEKVSCRVPCGTFIENWPLEAVSVPREPAATVTPGKGLPSLASVTLPEIVLSCAKALALSRIGTARSVDNFLM